jgi:hypothetical protein
MRKVRITEIGLKQLIMRIVEQVEENENDAESDVVKILASDFLKIFRYTNSVDGILNAKKYKDSKVVIEIECEFEGVLVVATLSKGKECIIESFSLVER